MKFWKSWTPCPPGYSPEESWEKSPQVENSFNTVSTDEVQNIRLFWKPVAAIEFKMVLIIKYEMYNVVFTLITFYTASQVGAVIKT